MRPREGMGASQGDPGFVLWSESKVSGGETPRRGGVFRADRPVLCYGGDSSSACPAICPGPRAICVGSGSRAVRTVDLSAPGGKGQSTGGTEQERQLGHRKTAAATSAHCDILFGSSFPSPLAGSEPCLPPQLLAFSVHTITGCDPFEERKWGGRAVLIAHF